MVEVRRRLEYGGIEYVVVLQPDGSFASVPAWMTELAASHFEIGDGLPRFPLDILGAMRAEVDALLSFLLPESQTETADGAQIHKSLTKPVRCRATVRDAVPDTAATTLQSYRAEAFLHVLSQPDN